jgi:hypothetical protein
MKSSVENTTNICHTAEGVQFLSEGLKYKLYYKQHGWRRWL